MGNGWSNQVTNLIVLVEQVSGYSGLFGYSPAPGPGNLVFSLTAAPGTDPYGNAYFNGLNLGNQQGAHFGIDLVGTVFLANSSGLNVIELRPYAAGCGLFVYDNATGAAQNHLAVAVANAAGTDGASNSFPAGVSSLNWSSSLFAQLYSGMLNLGGIVSGSADTTNAAQVAYVLGGGGKPYLHIGSPLYPSGGYTDPALALLQPGVPGAGLNGSSRPIMIFIDNAASSAMDVNLSGAMIKTSLDGATPYTWQTPTLNSPFAQGGYSGTSYANLTYRLDAEDNLVLAGTFHNTGSVANSSTVFTLPVGYRPAANYRGHIGRQVSGATNPENSGGTGLLVQSNGAVILQLDGASSSTMNYYTLLQVPMGNIS
jgi:hypothetical protein